MILVFYDKNQCTGLVLLASVAHRFYLCQGAFILIARFFYVSMIFKTESCLRSDG